MLLDRARRRPMEMHRTQLLLVLVWVVWFTCRTGKFLATWEMETIGRIIDMDEEWARSNLLSRNRWAPSLDLLPLRPLRSNSTAEFPLGLGWK